MNLNYLLIIFLFIWLFFIYKIFKTTNIIYEISLLIFILLSKDINEIYNSLLLQWYFLKEVWEYKEILSYSYVTLKIFFTLVLTYRIIIIFILDSFKLLYYYYPELKHFVYNIVGFTDIFEFKHIYSIDYLNFFFLLIFILLIGYFNFIQLEKVLFDFFYIFYIQTHIIFYLAYTNKFSI